MNSVHRPRYRKINKLVEEILGDLPRQETPVRIENIVRTYGVEVREGPLGEVSGLLVRHGDHATIGVNAGQARVRKRFTIAHEFGHFLLHDGITHHVDHTYKVNFRDDQSSQASNVEEIEANYFAAAVLMPERLLEADEAWKALDDDADVKELAKKYDVSQHAMSLRLANVFRRYSPY